MKLIPLSKCFPVTDTMASLYGGSYDGTYFRTSFVALKFVNQVKLVNEFLKANDFDIEIETTDFADKKKYEIDSFEFIRDLTALNQIYVIYHQPISTDPMNEILKFLNNFREQRDWKKFHSSKDLTMAIGSEAGELLDLFLWDRDKAIDEEKVKNELADIITYCIYLADNFKIDLLDAVISKAIANEEKYPIAKSKGNAKKYNEL